MRSCDHLLCSHLPGRLEQSISRIHGLSGIPLISCVRTLYQYLKAQFSLPSIIREEGSKVKPRCDKPYSNTSFLPPSSQGTLPIFFPASLLHRCACLCFFPLYASRKYPAFHPPSLLPIISQPRIRLRAEKGVGWSVDRLGWLVGLATSSRMGSLGKRKSRGRKSFHTGMV